MHEHVGMVHEVGCVDGGGVCGGGVGDGGASLVEEVGSGGDGGALPAAAAVAGASAARVLVALAACSCVPVCGAGASSTHPTCGGGGADELSDGELSDAPTELGEARGLAFGTADPHRVGDSDRMRQPRRRPVRLGTREGASTEELEARPFARVNVPPVTAPRGPPPPVPEGAPIVTDVAQVVPVATLRLVSRWRRRLRRCFRAAARGDYSLARRLRPDDLWLAHEHHSMPSTSAWDWDLRPLERGEPAVPLPVSGRDGVVPLTSICREAVAAESAGFRDAAIVSEMLHGISDDSACARGTLLCAPHAGALRLFEVAVSKAVAARGTTSAPWSSGAHESLPCWPLRSCPYSVVDESARAGRPKFRLTTDLSWPHPGAMPGVDSVNDGIDRSAWPQNRLPRVLEYAEALAILRGHGGRRRARAWSLDCEAYYRAAGRQRSQLWRNAIFTPDGVQLDERCCFGDASAATKCARISNFLVERVRCALDAFDEAHPTRDAEWLAWLEARRRLAQQRGARVRDFARLSWYGQFIDDGLGASADDLVYDVHGSPVLEADGVHRRRATAHMMVAREVLARFGWMSAPSKEVWPTEHLESLGVELDLAGERLRLSPGKRARYAEAAEAMLQCDRCQAASFRQLMGRLEFASQCYPLGRQFTHGLWRAARARYRFADGSLRLSGAAREELAWWVRELRSSEHRGVPLAQPDEMPPVGAGAGAIYADACGEGGFAAWTVVGDALLFIEGEVSHTEMREHALGIAELELLASTWGLVALAPFLPPAVVSFTDNTVALSAMRRLSTRADAPAMAAVIRRRTHWLLEHAVVEAAERITSANNVWADWGSRGRVGDVCAAAARLGLVATRVEIPAGWRDLGWLAA